MQNQAPKSEALNVFSRFSSAVEQRFCKPKVGSSILSTGTSNAKDLEDDLGSKDCLAKNSLCCKRLDDQDKTKTPSARPPA
jgi:hypothetical protein